MNVCIYCRAELPSDVPKEHVIPQSFGTFTPDLTLTCVCSACNGYFGSKLEWSMRVESIEGIRRIQFGLAEGKVGGIRARGIDLVVGEGDWKGARASLHRDKHCNEWTEILPQVGARKSADDEFEWCLEKDLTVEFAERYPKGSEYRMVGGTGPEDLQRLQEKLQVVCPSFVYKGNMTVPFSETDGKIMLHAEHEISRVVVRCLCKIAFNYMALTCGHQFALSSSFDDLRAFIRFDSGGDEGRAFVKQKPIIAQEIISGQRGTDGHVLTIDGHSGLRTLEVQVALFNSIPYRIPICRDYMGHRFSKGHHFDVENWEVSEMKVVIAGPNFDPARLR